MASSFRVSWYCPVLALQLSFCSSGAEGAILGTPAPSQCFYKNHTTLESRFVKCWLAIFFNLIPLMQGGQQKSWLVDELIKYLCVL